MSINNLCWFSASITRPIFGSLCLYLEISKDDWMAKHKKRLGKARGTVDV